jgi:hypothetical protein
MRLKEVQSCAPAKPKLVKSAVKVSDTNPFLYRYFEKIFSTAGVQSA